MNLRTKLIILFVLTAVIPLSMLGLFTYQKSSNMMQEQVSEGVLEKIVQINKNLSFFTRDVEQLSMYIYRHEMVQEVLAKSGERNHVEKYEDYKRMDHLFETVLGSKKWDVRIYMIGLNGDRFFTGDYLPTAYDQYMENWGIFRKANEANGNLVWDTHYSMRKVDHQEVVLSAGRLLKHIETNEAMGYLIIDILEPAVADIYRTDRNQTDQQLFLLDQQGYVISSSPNKARIGTRLEYPFLDQLLIGDGGFFETNWEDERHVIVYDTAEETHFKIASFVPLTHISERNRSIGQLTLALAGIGLLCAVWLAYFLSKTVTSPLYQIMSLMKKVEQGNLAVSFNRHYKDDIGILGNSFNRMVLQLRRLIQDGYEKQVRLKESEIKALKAQINPHFLYNTLETVNWMAKMKGLSNISKMVVSLGEMMRFSVRKGEDLVLLSEDVRHLEHYLNIQQIRYQDKFTVRMELDEEALRSYIPSLLLQPLVENAITHGLEMKIDRGNLWVTGKREGELLYLCVEDDGVGIDSDTLAKIQQKDFNTMDYHNTGIGLQNVQRRIQIHYGDQYDIDVRSAEGKGTKVTLRLPFLLEGGDIHA
ncbi:sensor histidine kinase [Bacillus horti]|uniref:histidine kinase n=2 Tax=Caldalkalibacillus horti TaxID=77523 RepID=A0ABT9W575_9BACI|nr:two-component system sensor histidine kinase YesM [Bacillus horti]